MMFHRIVLAGTCLMLIASCDEQTTNPATAEESSFNLVADQIAYGVRTNLTEDGIRRAVLNSDSAFTYESSRKLDLIGVNVIFFNDIGEQIGTLTSQDGEYDQSNSLFVARSNVVLIADGPDGQRRLTTNELFYDVSADRLWSDREFTLEEGGRVTTGTNFRSDSDFETWTVQGAETSGIVADDSDLTF